MPRGIPASFNPRLAGVTLAWLATLGLLWLAIDRVVSIQRADVQRAVAHDFQSLQQFAENQSAAFADTGFIGYSVGRYYGFASAFGQISPDPERAAVMLRETYGRSRGQTRPTDLPPALLSYETVHDRFHPSFVSMISASAFDDLYLIDRNGRVVYSLRKDAALGADLRDPRYRDLPLASLVRSVMARLQQEDAAKVVVVSLPQTMDDGSAILLGRPIIRHGSVEGLAVFRLPAQLLEQRLVALERPGIRLALLGGNNQPIDPARIELIERGADRIVTGMPPGWAYLLLTDSDALAGGLRTGFWILLIPGLLVLCWPAGRHLNRRRLPAGLSLTSPALSDVGTPEPARPVDRVELQLPPIPISAPEIVTPAVNPLPNPAVQPSIPPVADEPDEPDHPADDGTSAAENTADPGGFDADQDYRRALVDTITLALDIWQRARGKGKIELAEESGLWRVYMDRSSLQTRTLDKYLLVETLPRNPRWRDVVRTAEYVLRHCPQPGLERDGLVAALSRLKQQLRQADRI
jgi:hypothetical protein